MWSYREICISEIDELLQDGYEIEVDSPDGYVPVNFFIDKGLWQEYILVLENGTEVRCNENHLFETNIGWQSAKKLIHMENIHYLTKFGYMSGCVRKTEELIPIVDINVEHENHRYFTNDISSHNTGVGKSIFMCHCASNILRQGKNVLYITMEMAEERIAERIDANLLNVSISDIESLDKELFLSKVQKLSKKTQGKLIIKEYPTSSAHAGHFRALLEELKIKKGFIPDFICIDYINICASQRIRSGSDKTYTYVKAIAEEIRGLAVEYNVPILSATQTNRQGVNNSDIELTDTSECVWTEEKIQLVDGSVKRIGDVKPGDRITANDTFKTVMFVHHEKIKECIKITLKSGKSLVVSKDHIFPTQSGRKCVNSGLTIGDLLHSK